jgi:hypothetical protein
MHLNPCSHFRLWEFQRMNFCFDRKCTRLCVTPGRNVNRNKFPYGVYNFCPKMRNWLLSESLPQYIFNTFPQFVRQTNTISRPLSAFFFSRCHKESWELRRIIYGLCAWCVCSAECFTPQEIVSLPKTFICIRFVIYSRCLKM